MDLKKHIRSIQDYPKKGILFRDITTLIKNPEAFRFTNDKIIELSKKMEFDKVSAIESRGFVFASAISYVLNKPFILLRKKNKLPAETHSVDFMSEASVAGFIFVINLFDLLGNNLLKKKGYKTECLIEFPGH